MTVESIVGCMLNTETKASLFPLDMRCEVFMALKVQMAIFWFYMPCNIEDIIN
jgi:hypothetical protein